jgi:hypothetical protein
MSGAVSVASVASASLAPEIASSEPAVWSASPGADERLFALWRRYRAADEALFTASEESNAARDLLPPWAKPGSLHIDQDGMPFGPRVGFPLIELSSEEIADLPGIGTEVRMTRPSPTFIENGYSFYRRTRGLEKAEEWLQSMEGRQNDARARTGAEEAKLNIPALHQAWLVASQEHGKIEEEIRSFAPVTPNSIAALILVENQDSGVGVDDWAPRLLHALRTQLTGVIAEEAAELIDNAYTGDEEPAKAA